MAAADRFHEPFQRPIWVIAMVCQMLLGAGLIIALVVKIYMLIFTDHVCTAEAVSLGNTIRCTPVIELVAHFLMAVAAFRFASLMFSATMRALPAPLLAMVAGVFLLFISDLTTAGANWQIALTIFALLGTMGALYTVRVILPRKSDRTSD